MANMTELIDRYIAAWNEPDAGRRRELVAGTWTDAGTYVDPHRAGDGHEHISQMIGQVRERFPAYRFRLAGAAEAHNDHVRFRWEAGGTEDAPLYFAGTDFGVVAKDGRFTSITGFVDAAPAAAPKP